MILLSVSKTCSKTKSVEDDLDIDIEDIKYDGAENLNSSPCGLFLERKMTCSKMPLTKKGKNSSN